MPTRPAETPEPPYYAVVFTSQRTEGDDGYAETADRMEEIVAQQPGFLGADSTRDANGFGITVAYFSDDESIRQWYHNPEHAEARDNGRAKWYQHYALHVAKVERAYRWDR
jgi:heme-degrading monooxygenase HmoA